MHPVAAIARSASIALLVFVFAGPASGTRAAAQAVPPAAQNAILARVDQHYNHLRSLQTHYVERYSGMGLSREESGTLLLKKPGRMLWRYDQPPGKVFVLDGKYAWFYTPGDRQAQRLSARRLDDLRTPLRFLLGHTQLHKELEQVAVTPEGDNYQITGVPRGLEKRVRSLVLEVTADGSITSMKIIELDGATTEFDFSGAVDDAPTQPSDFVFTPPPGVAVVDALPPV